MPWVSNHFSIDMPNVPSPFPSSPWPIYMNPSFGSGGTMGPSSTSSFDRSHVPQPTLIVGGWNLPSYGSSHSHVFLGADTQMGGYSTYYTPSVYPSSAMSFPSNTFPMVGPHISSGISYGGNQFYDSGYPLHGTPSHGGNIYPHLNNPYHTFVSSQTSSSVMMLVQTSIEKLGEGYYLSGQGQGVNQDPSWPAMSQNQSFLGPCSQISQLTTITSPVTASHTGAPSPTTASHVGDWSRTSASHVEDPQPAIASHVGGITLVAMRHTDITYPTSVHHVGDELPASSRHAENMSPAIVNVVGGVHAIEKPRRVRRKARFLYRTCEGNHLTRLCPATAGIPEAWFSPGDPLGSEAFVVSPHSISPLIDTPVMPMQFSPEHTPNF
jgi:hypothetical protein